MELELSPRQITKVFLYTVIALFILNVVSLALYFYFSEIDMYILTDYFDFGVEGNIPTFYSACAILVCSAVLGLITVVKWQRPQEKRGYWLGLSLIFFFLALDEATAIHEWFSNIMDNYMAEEGMFYFLWVVPYAGIVAIFGLVYLRFVLSLPRTTRIQFIVSGLIFVTGAMGVEMISGSVADERGTDTMLYSLFYTIEESLEMLGIVLFLHASTSYLADETGGVTFQLLQSKTG